MMNVVLLTQMSADISDLYTEVQRRLGHEVQLKMRYILLSVHENSRSQCLCLLVSVLLWSPFGFVVLRPLCVLS